MKISLLYSCFFILILNACAVSENFLGLYTRKEVEAKLEDGDHSFLQHINWEESTIQKLVENYSGSGYYLAQVYEKLGRPGIAMKLLQAEWEFGVDPYRQQSALMRARQYNQNEQWDKLVQIAQQAVAEYPDVDEFAYYLMHAYYRLERDAELHARYNIYVVQNIDNRAVPVWRVHHRLAEAQLWYAVSSQRENRDGWQLLYRKLFSAHVASEYQVRLYLYLQAHPELLEHFTQWEQDFFKAKYLQADKNYREAADNYGAVIESAPAEARTTIFTTRTIRDIGYTYFNGGYYTKGEEVLSTILGDGWDNAISDEGKSLVYEWRGRIAHARGRYKDAYTLFGTGNTIFGSDRLLWLFLRSTLEHDTLLFREKLQEMSPQIESPEYFSDLLERHAAELVDEREWKEIVAIQSLVAQFGAPRDVAQWNVLVAEIAAQNYLHPDDLPDERHIYRMVRAAGRQRQSLYYAIVAKGLIGELDSNIITYERTDQSLLSDNTDCLNLIDGYIKFGLIEEAEDWLLQCDEQLRTDTIIQYARQLIENAIYPTALRAMNTARRRTDFEAAVSDQSLLYPRAFADFMQEVYRANKLSPHLLYALVREESYFAASVTSHAGAIGLSQLMSGTAADVSRRMKIELEKPLTDPQLNLNIGGYHLRELLDEFDEQPVLALSAYNAGINRARRWQRTNGDLSGLLFAEAIPFLETRNYIRKILVSHINYAMLYGNTDPLQIVQSYFLDFEQGFLAMVP